jgi:hypothetical protein
MQVSPPRPHASGGVKTLWTMKEWGRRAPKVYPPLATERADSDPDPVCCIYHKARPVGESSSESESSDSNSSDSESEHEIDRRRLQANHSHHSHPRGRKTVDGESSEQSSEQGQGGCCKHGRTKHPRRKPSPNAYEKMPKSSKNTRGT